MTRTAIKRCFIGLLALAFALACVPAAAFPVTAEAAPVKLQNSTGTITVNSTTIAFAGHEWWVIGYGSDGVYPQPGSVTLLAKNNEFGTTAFKYGGTSNDYSGSDLQAEMISIATGINTNSPKEYGLIEPRTITTTDDANNNLATAVANQHIWPISHDEWGKIGNPSDARDFESNYWLRSPSGTDYVWFGQFGGDGISVATPGDMLASRPALSLDLSSVLFTSSADDTGKRAVTLDKTLSETEIPTGTIKLTVEDDANLKLASASFKSATDRDVTFTYSGATAGTTLSAMIQNKEDQQITHYGQLAVVGASGVGEAVLALPDDYNPIYQSIMLFVEELNADTETDFASVPLEFFVRYPEPTTLGSIPASSISAADGEITGTSTAMEYKLSIDFGWQDVTGTAITGLVPGTYEVRVKESGVVGFSRVVPVTVGARPNVVSITPSGTSAPITSTELVITFDAQMDPLKGTVAINGTAITEEPAWSDDKKVAVYPLPSLDYGTTYNVTLSGFENGPGIPMTSFTGHSFTTEPDPTKADAASGSGTLANTGDNAPHLPAFALLALSGLLAFALRSTRQRSDS